MMTTRTQDITPFRLKRKRWEAPRRYRLTTTQEKSVRGDARSLQCHIPLTLVMARLNGGDSEYVLQLKRPDFNGSRDYDKLQWVFAKLMALSRLLHIRTSRSGAVAKILNEQQIRSQWSDMKQQILAMYDDPLVEQILARQQHNLTHHLQSMYWQDPMMQFLFNDLFGEYPPKQPAETPKRWPRHLWNIAFPFIERKRLTGRERLERQVTIAVEGRADPERIDLQQINSYFGRILGDCPQAPYRFTYRGHYHMDTTDGSIREATLSVEGTLGEVFSKKIRYHLTRTNNE